MKNKYTKWTEAGRVPVQQWRSTTWQPRRQREGHKEMERCVGAGHEAIPELEGGRREDCGVDYEG